MRLLEIVAGEATRPEARDRLAAFADIALGKDVVDCRDTPGFVANRIGIYWMTVAMSEALALGITVEEADSIVGRPMGIPKTGVFGLADLTGIDLSPQVMRSMAELLPGDDPFHAVHDENGPLAALIRGMIESGYTGRKGKGGFYRLVRRGGKRVKEARDLATGRYRAAGTPRLASAGSRNLRDLVSHPDKGGAYAWRVLSRTLSYVAGLVPEIGDDLAAIDRGDESGLRLEERAVRADRPARCRLVRRAGSGRRGWRCRRCSPPPAASPSTGRSTALSASALSMGATRRSCGPRA